MWGDDVSSCHVCAVGILWPAPQGRLVLAQQCWCVGAVAGLGRLASRRKAEAGEGGFTHYYLFIIVLLYVFSLYIYQ